MVGLKDHMPQFKDDYHSEDRSRMPVNEGFIPSKMTKTKFFVQWIDVMIKRLVQKSK